MRQFVPIKKKRKTNKQKAISRIQRDRFIEEERKPKVKRNGVLIDSKTKQKKNYEPDQKYKPNKTST